MSSRRLAAVKCRAAVLLALGASAPGFAQTPPSGEAAIDSAISDAVKEGSSPYRPTPRPSGPPQDPQLEECKQLLAQINETPKRSYRPSDAPVENSQGNDVLAVERDRTRRQLQRTFNEKWGR